MRTAEAVPIASGHLRPLAARCLQFLTAHYARLVGGFFVPDVGDARVGVHRCEERHWTARLARAPQCGQAAGASASLRRVQLRNGSQEVQS